ncbi:MAG TPA: glutaredoxin family protein [Candidatus Acidoferrum sp.]|nr:glutaredoxin family protein [Candidatus Acidoferrum sp.]
MNQHPEDLRLAGAGALDVTLYSRPGCHLCEAAKAAIHPLLAEFGATLHEISIEGDPVLTERYGWDIPVLFIGGRKAAKHRINVRQLRRQLKEARENAQSQLVMVRKKGA